MLILDLRDKLANEDLKVEFELNSENSMPTEVYNNWFALDRKSGIVRTRYDGTPANMNIQNIDYEKHREVLLGVNVIDVKTFELLETVMLKINIKDVNDNAPVFDGKFNYEVSVNEDDKQTIGQERLLAIVNISIIKLYFSASFIAIFMYITWRYINVKKCLTFLARYASLS